LLFLLLRGVVQVAVSGRWARFHESFLDPHLVYALPLFVVLALALQFILQMNRMVRTRQQCGSRSGRGSLRAGKPAPYPQEREQTRIIGGERR
jgi:hypothetical protein